MCKMKFLLQLIASTGAFTVAFPVKNPAVVCYDTLKTHFTLQLTHQCLGSALFFKFCLFIYVWLYFAPF